MIGLLKTVLGLLERLGKAILRGYEMQWTGK